MGDHGADGELYSGQLIGRLELVWGEGWLSPGGPEEVAAAIEGIDFRGKTVLDIGCGVGGVDFLRIETHGALHVTGVDVEDTVFTTAPARRGEEPRGKMRLREGVAGVALCQRGRPSRQGLRRP